MTSKEFECLSSGQMRDIELSIGRGSTVRAQAIKYGVSQQTIQHVLEFRASKKAAKAAEHVIA